MTRRDEYAMPRVIQVAELIGEFDDECPRSLLVKLSDEADSSSPLQSINWKLKSRKVEQRLKLTQSNCILVDESVLNIAIHKKHSLRQKALRKVSGDELLCEARIQFDDLWKHRAPETQEIRSNFKVEFNPPIQGLHGLAIEVCNVDLNAQHVRIKAAMVELNRFRSFLSRFDTGSNVGGMMIDLGKAASGFNHFASTVFAFFEAVFKNLKVQQESHDIIKRLAEGMSVLAGQLDRLKEIPKSEELCRTISESPRMMDEVLVFIQEWLKSWTSKYILVQAQKDKATGLRDKLHAFTERFDRDLLIEIRLVQAIEKELHDLVIAIGGNRLSLRGPCMEGTRHDILQQIETEIKNTNGHNVIWIRGSPGVGKSALAASITKRIQDQNRHVIWFRFDRTESTTITTNALWRIVARDLARWYPSIRQQLAQGNTELSSSNIDHLFKTLIEEPLSALKDISDEELAVIVIDALDECGGLRHDSPGMDDFKGLLRTLERWTLANCLKKFKLIITSRPEDRITRTFPDTISTHVNIPSGKDIKPGDSASNDICAFLKDRFENEKMEAAWVQEALDFLVPRAAGMFIWATTAADFLLVNPEARLGSLKRGDDTEGLNNLHSLYLTVIKTSFGGALRGEIKAITSVVGATIFAKQPLDDAVLMRLPGVESPHMLKYIKKGLMSVIDSGSIFRFHHRSFEDFLLSPSSWEDLPKFSGIRDRSLHERQLAVLCLNTMVSSELHFNMCNLKSSSIKNADITAANKSSLSPLVSYSSLFWADHLVQTQCEEILVEAVKFIMYEKLLFWIEVMSILGKAHEVSAILKKALEWHGLVTLDPNNELTSFIHDTLRFISAFLVPISQSAPQIYLSALPFTPERSLVGQKFRPRFPNTLTIIDGRPSEWPKNIFAAEHHKNPVKCIVLSPDEKTFVSTSSSSSSSSPYITTSHVCDSETGHCILGPFESKESGYSFVWRTEILDACFSPDGKHILVRSRMTPSHHAVVWEIERREKVSRIEGFDFVFIHCGRNKGRIASMDWIDEDGPSIWTIAWTDQGSHPTRILRVKLWDIGNDISDRLFEVTGVAVTRFSPNGQYLAVGRPSENVVELWNLEDGKRTHRFPYPLDDISSLHFSPTSDCLMAALEESRHKCLWRLDTQEMTSFDLDVEDIPPAIIHLPNADRLFVPRDDTVEIWEVSMTGPNMIFKTEPLTTSSITSICPLRDGHRLLVGSRDGTVMMRNMEDFGSSQPVVQDVTDRPKIIGFSPSGKMVATRSWRPDYVYHFELRDIATWELVGPRDVECKGQMEVAFSADDKRIAVLTYDRVTICDIMHPENRLSFDPWPKGRHVYRRKVAFPTCNHLVICAQLFDGIPGLLQVWKLKDHSECTSSLDIKCSDILLAPDGLTVIFTDPVLCYSWNHETAQFDRIHFTDEAHLDGVHRAYSPDGKFFACHSHKDYNIRVWDTRTGQLCGKPTTMSYVNGIALSPALNDQSLGDRLIAVRCYYDDTITLFDVYTGHLYAQCWDSGANMAFIGDGTKLASYRDYHPIRIYDIVGLASKQRNAVHGYQPVPQDMNDGWVVGQDDELLFWVPLEHREGLCLPHVEMIWGRPTKVDLSRFRYGSKWTECIDQGWLKELEESVKRMARLLE